MTKKTRFLYILLGFSALHLNATATQEPQEISPKRLQTLRTLKGRIGRRSAIKGKKVKQHSTAPRSKFDNKLWNKKGVSIRKKVINVLLVSLILGVGLLKRTSDDGKKEEPEEEEEEEIDGGSQKVEPITLEEEEEEESDSGSQIVEPIMLEEEESDSGSQIVEPITLEKKENTAYDISHNEDKSVYTLDFGQSKFKISFRLREDAEKLNFIPLVDTDKDTFDLTEGEYNKAKQKISTKLNTLQDYFNTLFRQLDKIEDKAKKMTLYHYIIDFSNQLPEELTAIDVEVIRNTLTANHFDSGDTVNTHCPDGLVNVIEELSRKFAPPTISGPNAEKIINEFKLTLLTEIVMRYQMHGSMRETVGIPQYLRNSETQEAKEIRKATGLEGIGKTVQHWRDFFYGWDQDIETNKDRILKDFKKAFTLERIAETLVMHLSCPKGKELNDASKDIENITGTGYLDDPIKKVDNVYAYFNQALDFSEDLEVVGKNARMKKNKPYSMFVIFIMLSCMGLVESTYKHDADGNPVFDKDSLANENAIYNADKRIAEKMTKIQTK